ncbi:MAG: hypothetical protein KY455_12935 [Euryarchaeota archaeon]|nr:hypothetical protein [Euryarchaeota archaeon]
MSSSVRSPLLMLLSTALVVSGCLSDPDPNGDDSGAPALVVPDGWWEGIVPSSLTDEAHDHTIRSHHANLTTDNFEVVGWDPLVTDHYNSTLTGMGCGGAVTRDDGRRLAVVHSIATDVSFVVADITDPTTPRMLGEFYLPNSVVWDADISADGMHVLIGAYPPIFGDPTPVLPPVPPALGDLTAPTGPAWAEGFESLMVFRNSCTGEVQAVGPENYLPGPAIVMAGIQDPENPVFEQYVPQPVIGPHSVGSQIIDGKVYATSSVTNLAHEGSYYTIFEIVDDRLVPVSTIRTPGTASSWTVTKSPGSVTPFLNGHTDVFLHKHPLTDQFLAYLANWDGMYVYDLTVPQAPVEVSVWMDGKAGSVHTTYPFPFLRDGKQYLVVGQEVGEPVDLPSGWVYLLDITDPAAPEEVGRWTLPVKPKWDDGGLQFSPHYVAVSNETLFVSNYHGGLWAVDISDLSKPLANGLFVPDRDSPASYGGKSYGPVVEDVIIDPMNGILTVWDNGGGVYQLRFLDKVPAARAPAWVET